jgi:hypothetical protein
VAPNLHTVSGPGRGKRDHKGLVEMKDQGLWFFVVFFGMPEMVVWLAAAHVAQLAERVLGKDEVTSSTLVMGSRII